MPDRIRHLTLSHVVLPLENPVSDAKVLTGRQKPLTETVLLFVEVTTEQGLEGMGFSYSKRAGGPGPVRPPAGDRRRRDRRRTPATSTGSTNRCCGPAPRSAAPVWPPRPIAALDVALWDLKARRASLPLAKLLGAHRDSVPGLQHLRRLPAGVGRGDQGEGHRLARVRHRRHQDQSGPTGLQDGPRPRRRPSASTSATAR